MSAVLDLATALAAPPAASGWQVLDHDRHDPAAAARWDAFVRRARNGLFLFERGYMDYHAERFDDASLLLLRNGEVRAALPAHRSGDTLVSHGGLTFGGLLLHEAGGLDETLDAFDALTAALRARGLRRLRTKPVPHALHRLPAEDELFALHRAGARCVRMEAATTIDLARRPPLAKGRRHALAKARRAGLQVERSDDLAGYWQLLSGVLAARHGAAPTHRLDEIVALAARFPEDIALHVARRPDGTAPLAGALTYRYPGALHTQYLACGDEGREHGALDAVIAHLIDAAAPTQRWLSFGSSTLDGGRGFNAGLVAQKEMFGGRTTVMPTYEIDLD
ncbi:MAG TPA: GNAT family N-acetyltransferase [Methylibium sp.]|uniref:GNAT family N-acetyltransferase n=1 Tax=Methylibium sp. TaxID=2067992 RepID=UPI002DB8A8DA|nr:GNAT family N-acetyltransferase [Methylibium sp.]HEU4457627.1 GNAT family N-acetyltransferase [Methylibium sp.]